jgi:hypothetical protein
MCLYEQLVEHPEAELYIMNGMRAMLRVDQQTIKKSQGKQWPRTREHNICHEAAKERTHILKDYIFRRYHL